MSSLLVRALPTAPRQGTIWMVTCPEDSWEQSFLSRPPVVYGLGQHELSSTGYAHVHALIHFSAKQSLLSVKRLCPTGHWELSRSAAAESYVWKDDTAVPGSRFEYGTKPFRRASKTDWDAVWLAAKAGRIEDVPASIRISSYRALKSIGSDYQEPVAMERTISVFWGQTGTGKSRRAWSEAGLSAYPKNPNTKFWDGYRGHENVVVDEFRGRVDISYLLTWCDRYPVIVEVKGSSTPLQARKIWFTSNLHPRQWYPDLDESTIAALLRRLEVVEIINV